MDAYGLDSAMLLRLVLQLVWGFMFSLLDSDTLQAFSATLNSNCLYDG